MNTVYNYANGIN